VTGAFVALKWGRRQSPGGPRAKAASSLLFGSPLAPTSQLEQRPSRGQAHELCSLGPHDWPTRTQKP